MRRFLGGGASFSLNHASDTEVLKVNKAWSFQELLLLQGWGGVMGRGNDCTLLLISVSLTTVHKHCFLHRCFFFFSLSVFTKHRKLFLLALIDSLLIRRQTGHWVELWLWDCSLFYKVLLVGISFRRQSLSTQLVNYGVDIYTAVAIECVYLRQCNNAELRYVCSSPRGQIYFRLLFYNKRAEKKKTVC